MTPAYILNQEVHQENRRRVEINYPTRCEIIDVEGQEVFPGIVGKTPGVSKPHIGKQGLAERIVIDTNLGKFDNGVQITLDDGNIIYGHECWWIPLKG